MFFFYLSTETCLDSINQRLSAVSQMKEKEDKHTHQNNDENHRQ